MNTLTFIIDEELEKAIRIQSELEQKTLNQFIIDILKEYLEDQEDYESAIASYNSVDMRDITSLENLCSEADIDYEGL